MEISEKSGGRQTVRSAMVSPVDTTTDDALGGDDMTGLLARLQRREVSADELRSAAVARAERANLTLNAVTTWTPESGGAAARSTPDAPLAGIPTFVKDNEPLAGYPTSEGSWAVPDRRSEKSGPWASQYLALGVNVLGKTTMSEFGLTASTETARFGPTRNPWNTDHSAGGSSGGSAALVAAGVVPIAHGNDGGGSIRIPASCCGLVGLKPSRGRVIDLPELERLPVVLGVQGVLTRTVRDTARYLAEAERAYRNPELPAVGHVQNGGGPRLRIGLVTRTIRDLPVSAETVATVLRAGELCESLGHSVEPTDPPVADAFGADFLRYWSFVAFVLSKTGRRLYGEGFDAARADAFTRGLSGRFLKSIERFPGSLRRLRRLASTQEPSFERFDVLLSPVLGHAPPPIGYLAPDVEFETHLARLLRYTSFTPVQNVSGSPALSLPMGRSTAGVPIGVQLAAPLGREARLLSLGYELEEAAPWATRVGAV
jgi:amidase